MTAETLVQHDQAGGPPPPTVRATLSRLVDEHPTLWRIAGLAMRGVRQPTRGVQIRRYLDRHQRRRLLIGTGFHPRPGWLCADVFPVKPSVVFLDATRPFPLPSSSFDVIHTEHMIEHVPYAAGVQMIRECRRVLKDGGVIRIATPDLRRMTDLMAPDRDETKTRYISWSNTAEGRVGDPMVTNPAFTVNRMMRAWGHQFIYDEATLRSLLEECGFSDVVRLAPGQSAHEDLIGVERHQDVIGDEFNLLETMVIEATA